MPIRLGRLVLTAPDRIRLLQVSRDLVKTNVDDYVRVYLAGLADPIVISGPAVAQLWDEQFREYFSGEAPKPLQVLLKESGFVMWFNPEDLVAAYLATDTKLSLHYAPKPSGSPVQTIEVSFEQPSVASSGESRRASQALDAIAGVDEKAT